MYFPTDPGYRDTARMLVEAGLVLALEPQRTQVHTRAPAACRRWQTLLFYCIPLWLTAASGRGWRPHSSRLHGGAVAGGQ